jgi:hypothetical protein
MVSVSLYNRTTIPTIRSCTAPHTTAQTGNSGNTFVEHSGAQITVPAGCTAFITTYVRNNHNGQNYVTSYLKLEDPNGTELIQHSGYHNGGSYGHTTYKNTTASDEIIKLYTKCSTTGASYTEYQVRRVLIMNDSDLAKWEVLTVPIVRDRKYAVDKYYLCSKWENQSCNIEGISTSGTGVGIKEIPVESIVSRTEFTGSGEQFFQITGKGFSASN